MKLKDSFDKVFEGKGRILVVTAHPDDCEIICGGTIARLIDSGHKVRLVITTQGGKGFQNREDITEEEFAKLRRTEQLAAGLKLGIPEEENFNLGIPDGELENTLENIEKLVFHIRDFKPDIVITHSPDEAINTFDGETNWVNHRDHRHTAQLTLDAVYPYSRDRGFFPHHFGKGLAPHTVEYLLISDSYTHPKRVYFKVDDQIDKKRAALLEHKNALGEEIEAFIEELKQENGYFECLRFVKI
jgi:LmbE family N-acetylglucosaminyl deacetylase